MTGGWPSALIAVVEVSQPVTASVWPVSSGAKSEPMTTTSTSFSGILCFFSRAEEQDLAGRLDADLLADHVLRFADRLLFQREERVGMLLQHGGEALHRDLLGGCQHERGARRHLADLVPAGGDDRHAVDAGTARLDHDIELLLFEVAHVLGDDLADVVVAGEPAELKVDGLRLGLGEAARWQEICGGSRGGCRPRE